MSTFTAIADPIRRDILAHDPSLKAVHDAIRGLSNGEVERIRVTLGTPAKYVMCGRQYRELKADDPQHVKQMYYLVGQHLLLADAMFVQSDPKVQLSGIGIANEVITVLAQTLKDGAMAARYC